MSPEIDATMRSSGPGRSEPSMQSLVEQADGLGRAAVMKDVVGPALDEVMRPVYHTEFGSEEKITLGRTPISTPARLQSFGDDVETVLRRRFSNQAERSDIYLEIGRLDEGRDDLFYHHNSSLSLFRESIESGVVIPLTVASHIYKLEKGDPLEYGMVGENIFNIDHLVEIMQRKTFDEILLHLTKGPNGFLGITSSRFRPINTMFFNFEGLKAKDFYDVVDGKVTGLSGLYHISANKRRKELRNRQQPDGSMPYNGHKNGCNSSGCPVRHSFEDPESGELQEPLVITAKNFLVAALKINTAQQADITKEFLERSKAAQGVE